MAPSAEIKVLIVEDSILTAQELCSLIADMPYDIDCSTAATESDAVAAIAEKLPDIVVLDLRLKEGSGFNVLRKLKALGHKARVVVLSNYALPQYREFAFLTGADFFLDKAVEFSAVPTLLESWIQEKTKNKSN